MRDGVRVRKGEEEGELSMELWAGGWRSDKIGGMEWK